MKPFSVWSWVVFVSLVGCEGTSIVGRVTSDGGGMDAAVIDVSCPTGQRTCGGRCVDPSVDPLNCGACGAACSAGQACVAGACELRCPGTQAVCAGQCTNLQTDSTSCGACGRACAAGQVCSLGRCSTTCDASLATCSSTGDGGVATTRCVDARTDRLNCGACGVTCAAGQVCVDRACVLSCAGEQRDCGGSCRDLATDNAHCGACGNACPAGNTCVAGACAVSCSAGLSQCGESCANLQTDRLNCGACGTMCAAGQVCSGGVCGASCAAPATTCGTGASRYCANTAIDPLHCGGCDGACALPNTRTQGCTGGECAVVRCATGYGDCDGLAPNGCETDTTSTVAHCGGCGRACALAHATSSCGAGACAVTACDAGFADCDRVASNGCEVDTRTDNANCGACAMGCGAGQVCSGGACGATCAAPLATCGAASTAYCANTAIDPTNCGSCSRACALAHVEAHGCAGGACTVGRCAAGFGDCNGTSSDGCETDLAASATSCGACGRACALPNATATCAAGACAISACAAGYFDCDGLAANGCEVDTRTDNAHCGSCTRACAAGQVCSGGACGTTCATPLLRCGTAPDSFCADPAVDPANCGACARACALDHVATHGCAASACTVLRCASGYGDCNATAGDGCETDLQTSAASCGACGRACALSHATSTCTAGACAISACAMGFLDCDGVAANGCEVDARTDNAHCGSCTRVCDPGTMCSGGTCGATCQASQANCSGTCATLASDPLHCGDCARVCPTGDHATTYCAAGACGLACAANFGDCDGVASTGCETDTRTTAAHCGGCGRACATGQVCAAGACACAAGQHLFGGACVGAGTPRPVAPLSLGDVTQRRPTLRWVLPAGYEGAVVELCRDRACTMVIETLTATGTSARPVADLPARSVVFWRLRARVGASVDTAYGPTWLFHVPAVSASGGVDTSSNPHFDVNGDGYDDVVVGAPLASPDVRLYVGAASVFYGSATWTQPAAGTARTPDRRYEGVADNDRFGYSVASAGDVNGDGYADLVVGAPIASPGGRMFAGTASVFYGGTTWTQPAAGTAAIPDRLYEGVAAGNFFGFSVAGAGDVNRDGYADVVVGEYNASPGGRTNAGTVSVFHGSATWTQPAPGTPAVPDRLYEGAAASDAFGLSVAGAGDVNGDGYDDLVVGIANADPGGRTDAGAASVFYGSATWTQPPAGTASIPDRRFEGDATSHYFGQLVASAGDLNGDGYVDVVVGDFFASPGGRAHAGTASVFYGSATWTQPAAGTPAIPDRLYEGAADGDNLGFAAAGAGDLNGDGFGDLVVGAYRANPGGRMTAGTASVFYGSATWTQPAAGTAAVPDRLLEGAQDNNQFGSSVASAGDVNGDGYADLVVGAKEASPGLRFAAGLAAVFYGSATWTQPAAGTAVVPSRLFEGAAGFDEFGRSVASAVDPHTAAPRLWCLAPPRRRARPVSARST